MRTVSVPFLSLISQSVIDGLAVAYRFYKRDGVIKYFADERSPVTLGDGETYEPDVAIALGSVTLTADDAASQVDLEIVAAENNPIVFTDIQDGLYNGGQVEVLLYNRNDLEEPPELLYWGDIREIKWDDTGHVNITLMGPLGRTRNYVAELYGGSCRAIFTDERCKVPKEDVTFYDAVVVGSTARFLKVTGPTEATDHWNLGLATITSGRLKGRKREIRKSVKYDNGDTEFELYIGFGINVENGVTVDVRQGCAYDLSDKGCLRYNNILNYRGEPYIDPEPVALDDWESTPDV